MVWIVCFGRTLVFKNIAYTEEVEEGSFVLGHFPIPCSTILSTRVANLAQSQRCSSFQESQVWTHRKEKLRSGGGGGSS